MEAKVVGGGLSTPCTPWLRHWSLSIASRIHIHIYAAVCVYVHMIVRADSLSRSIVYSYI